MEEVKELVKEYLLNTKEPASILKVLILLAGVIDTEELIQIIDECQRLNEHISWEKIKRFYLMHGIKI